MSYICKEATLISEYDIGDAEYLGYRYYECSCSQAFHTEFVKWNERSQLAHS